MPRGKYVTYLRVSTTKQGASGLGLEAQRKAVAAFLNGGSWTVLQEFVEIESGKNEARPKLAEALALCRIHNATLVIAKLDRLSRNVHFLTGLQKAGVRFVAADMPEANEMVVQIMPVVAQAERKMISKRTKDALAAKAAWYANLTDDQKADLQTRGKAIRLGGPKWDHLGGDAGEAARAKGRSARSTLAKTRSSDLAPIVADLRTSGITSLNEMARELTRRGIPTSEGAAEWSPMQVSRMLRLMTEARDQGTRIQAQH